MFTLVIFRYVERPIIVSWKFSVFNLCPLDSPVEQVEDIVEIHKTHFTVRHFVNGLGTPLRSGVIM